MAVSESPPLSVVCPRCATIGFWRPSRSRWSSGTRSDRNRRCFSVRAMAPALSTKTNTSSAPGASRMRWCTRVAPARWFSSCRIRPLSTRLWDWLIGPRRGGSPTTARAVELLLPPSHKREHHVDHPLLSGDNEGEWGTEQGSVAVQYRGAAVPKTRACASHHTRTGGAATWLTFSVPVQPSAVVDDRVRFETCSVLVVRLSVLGPAL